jgi:hypothetical protein
MKTRLIILAALIYSIASFSTTALAQSVDTPFQVKILASTSQVDSVISVTNGGARGAGTTPGNTAGVTGAICANFYAYSSVDGSLISCCSCPVAPNASRILKVNVDLISPPASSTIPTRTVVKLLASAPVGGSCNGSSTVVGSGAAALSTGLVATGTSVLTPFQVQPQITISQQSESPFLPTTLSAAELVKMTSQCTAYPGGGANKVCASCPN